jgi:hypothetical protein
VSVDRLREFWAFVERHRALGESWVDAAERLMYSAMVDEKISQNKIAEYMSTDKVTVNRRLQRYKLRPKDPPPTPPLEAAR